MASGSKLPVSRDPSEVTRRILDAAEAEFMANGYEAASTNRIAGAFGGSKATLFRHYSTKELLLRAVIERISRDWQGRVDPERIVAEEPSEWLLEFGIVTLEWILGDAPLFVGRLGIAEGHKLPELANVFHELAGAPLQEAVAARLRAWARSGKLRCRDAAADALSFFDLMIAGAVSRALYGVERLRGRELKAHAERSVDLFLNGRLVHGSAGSVRSVTD